MPADAGSEIYAQRRRTISTPRDGSTSQPLSPIGWSTPVGVRPSLNRTDTQHEFTLSASGSLARVDGPEQQRRSGADLLPRANATLSRLERSPSAASSARRSPIGSGRGSDADLGDADPGPDPETAAEAKETAKPKTSNGGSTRAPAQQQMPAWALSERYRNKRFVYQPLVNMLPDSLRRRHETGWEELFVSEQVALASDPDAVERATWLKNCGYLDMRKPTESSAGAESEQHSLEEACVVVQKILDSLWPSAQLEVMVHRDGGILLIQLPRMSTLPERSVKAFLNLALTTHAELRACRLEKVHEAWGIRSASQKLVWVLKCAGGPGPTERQMLQIHGSRHPLSQQLV